MTHATLGLAKSAGANLCSSVTGVLRSRSALEKGITRFGAADLSWSALLWPAFQQGLARVVCRYTKNRMSCDTLACVTREVRALRAPGQLLFALGVVSDAHQLGESIAKSFRAGTVRPAAAQATRSLTNWSAVWAGAELFGTGGAILGVATGPGAAVTSGLGALIGGYVGFIASEWIAHRIDVPN